MSCITKTSGKVGRKRGQAYRCLRVGVIRTAQDSISHVESFDRGKKKDRGAGYQEWMVIKDMVTRVAEGGGDESGTIKGDE